MDNIFKKHIFSLVTMVFIAVAILVGIIFFFSSMKVKVARVLDIKERISSYEKNKKEFTDEVIQLKTFEKRLTVLESQVINKATVPTLLSTFENLAQKSGTSFEITSVQTPNENNKSKLYVGFNIKGSYSNIQSFLDQVQHQPFQVNINSLSLFWDQAPQVEVDTTLLPTNNTNIKLPAPVKEKQWQADATIEVLSF